MRKTLVDVTVVMAHCHVGDEHERKTCAFLAGLGLRDMELLPECVVTGYIDESKLAELKKHEYIGYVRTGNRYFVDQVDN